MQGKKRRVTYTLDEDVIEAVRDRARRQTVVAGLKVSDSAAANMMLRERAAQDKQVDRPATPKGVTRPAPKPGKITEYKSIDDE